VDRWRIKLSVLAIIFITFLSACSVSSVTLTEKDNGSVITLRSGQGLQIILTGNLTTGYSWNIVSIDQTILEQVGKKDYKPESNRIGAGGHATFLFKAAEKGKTILKLAYCRVWEKDIPYEKMFTVTLSVR